jgi:uncharacterized protein YdhG (YjbR/CyaY superfamily)
MKTNPAPPTTNDQYIAAFPPEVQGILQCVRQVAREAAPEAQEVISHGMPAFKQGGILVYFAAFRNHFGLYPPVRGGPDIEKAIAPYAGKKGNLRFPFGKPIPYDLIARIAALRLWFRDGQFRGSERVEVRSPSTGNTICGTVSARFQRGDVGVEELRHWLLSVVAASPSLKLFLNGRELQGPGVMHSSPDLREG